VLSDISYKLYLLDMSKTVPNKREPLCTSKCNVTSRYTENADLCTKIAVIAEDVVERKSQL